MKRLSFVGLIVLGALAAPSLAIAGPISLYEVAFNIDGAGYSSQSGFQANDLDAATGSPFDVGAFDFTTGLGTIQVTVGGAGAHSVVAFFDLDLADQNNSAFDDLGTEQGAPGAGQGWEIDDPFAGDIYANAFGGTLDNTNSALAPGDVSMSLAWDLVVGPDELAILTFSTTENDPGGFRLRQFDASGAQAYLASTVRFVQRPVPEPVLSLLAGLAIAAGAARARRNRRA